MRPLRPLLLILPLLAAAAPPPGAPMALAAETAGIAVEQPWARPSIGAANASAAYLTITDSGPPDRLIGFTTPAAATAELHESVDDHGVMKMRAVADLPLEPGRPVRLAPGGYHVMLTGLTRPLKAGESFPLTLRFAHAAPLTIRVPVQVGPGSAAPGSAAPGSAAMPMDHGHGVGQSN